MDQMRFDGRVALVTGAGNGLGRAYAHLLAARGARVVVNDVGAAMDGSGTSDAPAKKVVEEIKARGGEAVANSRNVGEKEGAGAAVQAAIDAFGRIDIVVNNAGYGFSCPFAQYPTDKFRRLIDVSFMGTVWIAQAAWPHMEGARYGRIVNTSSASVYGLPGNSAYGAAKAAVLGLTHALALEGAEVGIKCNAISPSAGTRGVAAFPESELRSFLLNYLPPERAAVAVGYLAHEDCAVSGECIVSGGGRIARMFIGQTHGVVDPEITIEGLRDNLAKILDTVRFEILKSNTEAIQLCARQLGFEHADRLFFAFEKR
ncbi:MAG TPA: SDR family NAD(P)-dependent oxidoreductase [Candidatus Binataceae bacterium]|nr:SDR family NAD(P)-dependent oxidoreductase [Candidatus Binataceae bacterium]